jgi:hypothetical protein
MGAQQGPSGPETIGNPMRRRAPWALNRPAAISRSMCSRGDNDLDDAVALVREQVIGRLDLVE